MGSHEEGAAYLARELLAERGNPVADERFVCLVQCVDFGIFLVRDSNVRAENTGPTAVILESEQF